MVVGFCGLALLVVSLFVFWKLCWPIWRSKALSAHVENGLHVGFPEAPPPSSQPITKCKVVEVVEKKCPPEVKVNGRSCAKHLEGAMKISQTSPDIPAEVQTALREKLSQQAKIQRQTTEPTSSSRYRQEPTAVTTAIIILFLWHVDRRPGTVTFNSNTLSGASCSVTRTKKHLRAHQQGRCTFL